MAYTNEALMPMPIQTAQCLKGIAHPKMCSSMKIVIINHHHVVPTLYTVIFSMQNKRRTFVNVPAVLERA